MGANSSSFSDLATNPYLMRFASSEPISVHDPFWNQLLSYTFLIPINSSDAKLLEESTALTCKNLAINNCKTGNFGALVRKFLVRCTELKASAQCEDVCKYLVEHLSEDLLIQQFDAKLPKEEGQTADVDDATPMGEQLMTALVELLVDVPVLNFTYALHLEALNALLVLLSVQMFQPMPASKFAEKCPAELYKNTTDSVGAIANMTASLAFVTLGMGSTNEKKEEEFNETLLANQSLLFLMVLTNHCTKQSTAPTTAHATFKTDFTELYKTLCSTLRDDQTTLLLYLLIHRNPNMKAFILSRTNIDQLVMPLLKILYYAQEKNSHHIYMALIILLVLSEDDVFNKAVHEISLKNVPWFKERQMSEISLGGLLILVVIRTIHLFSQLCKKHMKLVEQIRVSAMKESQRGDKVAAPEGQGQGHKDDEEEANQEDYMQDLAVLEEVIRMVLEIINSCLTSGLHHNPHLVYTLLYQKDAFGLFRSHPTFQDVIVNIDTVLAYFSTKLEQMGGNSSPSEVLQFKYVEEESPEEFFIPYIWSLVYHSSNMYFNATKIILFSLSS
ncbi:DYM-like protein [Mya arenaria]|uniref:Dymeclin n=1 Tax=Mya arenaria TaxID=6604 RepID=A0ABY7GAK9_MYAAR|nr:DYM-like protein [Mya arenaria]